MRISDWSSDVCSSDLPFSKVPVLKSLFEVSVPTPGDAFTIDVGRSDPADDQTPYANRHAPSLRAIYDLADLNRSQFIDSTGQSGHPLSPYYRDFAMPRSAEHTSELQSLMRISYAVFCLKKKTNIIY